MISPSGNGVKSLFDLSVYLSWEEKEERGRTYLSGTCGNQTGVDGLESE